MLFLIISAAINSKFPFPGHVTCQLQRRADNYWGRQGDDDGDDDEDDADDEDDW